MNSQIVAKTGGANEQTSSRPLSSSSVVTQTQASQGRSRGASGCSSSKKKAAPEVLLLVAVAEAPLVWLPVADV